jgi:putative transposase
MCTFFGISRAAYYAWRRRWEQPERDGERMKQVQQAYEHSHRTYGYRRITLWLHKQGHLRINHKAVLRLMRKLNIRSVARQRKVFRTRAQVESSHYYENVLNQKFYAHQPNQKWVTDVTYIATRQGWAYLAVIKDLFDGFIISHRLGRENSLNLVLQTLKQAQQQEHVLEGLLLHRDQGHQYISHGYALHLQEEAITPSMSRRGNCWDNAPMESFSSNLKEEALRQFPVPSFEDAQHIIDDYIHFYNYERIQLKTRQTPYETRCLSA